MSMARPPRPRASRALHVCLLSAVLLSGCAAPCPPEDPIGYALPSAHEVRRLGRVVFVELVGDAEVTPRTARQTTEALAHALQARQLFHVDVVDLHDPLCRDLPLARPDALTLAELSMIRRALGCDAVLFGRLYDVDTFPHMRMGLYLRLIDLKDGRLVWGVDHVWDSADRALARRVRRYFACEVRDGFDPAGHEIVFTSPRAFRRFVAYETAATLPSRRPPAAERAVADAGEIRSSAYGRARQ